MIVERKKNMLAPNLVPILCLVIHTNIVFGLREYSKEDLSNLKEQVKEVFYHAYNGYLNHAFPYDELRPLSCDGVDTWGSYSLTLIDALDTLAIMGNYTEFTRVVELITERANFDININVSVFETNIRIVGGLLSAHLFSERAGLQLHPGWPCNGPLLRLAEDVARRLLPAFDTDTGMPYGTVNLRYGVPTDETPVTCTAGVGTYIIEFGTLSRLTGDPIYEEVALRALRSLYKRRSNIGLFGNHIDTKTGIWTAQDSGIGAGVDSYFEYLVKGAILFQRPELMAMFNEIRGPIEKYLKRDDWYLWVSMHKGHVTLPVFQSLEAFWPGVLSLVGDVSGALKSLHNYHQVWKQYGFLPEFYNIVNSETGTNRESYPLRPELIESVMYLHRATGDPYLLDVGQDILNSIQHSARTPCGYATIKNVVDHSQEDRMESFFLAETTKYLYLLFDTENFIHDDGNEGKIFETDAGKTCVLGAGGYIFNTEAHPVDVSALQCCSREKLGDMTVELAKPKQKAQDNRESNHLNTKMEAEGTNVEGNKSTKKGAEETPCLSEDVKLEIKEIDSDANRGEQKTDIDDVSKEVNEIDRATDDNVEDIKRKSYITMNDDNYVSTESNVIDRPELEKESDGRNSDSSEVDEIDKANGDGLKEIDKKVNEIDKTATHDDEQKQMERMNDKRSRSIDELDPPDRPSPPSKEFNEKTRTDASFDETARTIADKFVKSIDVTLNKVFPKDGKAKKFSREDASLLEAIEKRVEDSWILAKKSSPPFETKHSEAHNVEIQKPNMGNSELHSSKVETKLNEFRDKLHQMKSLDALERKLMERRKVSQKRKPNRVSLDELFIERIHLIRSEYSHLNELDQNTLNHVLTQGSQKLRENQERIDTAMKEDLVEVQQDMMSGGNMLHLKNLVSLTAKLDWMRDDTAHFLQINNHISSILKSLQVKQYQLRDQLSPEESQLKVQAIEAEMKKVLASQRNFDADQVEAELFRELSSTKIFVNSSLSSPDENDTEDSNHGTRNVTKLSLPLGSYAIIDHTLLSKVAKPMEKITDGKLVDDMDEAGEPPEEVVDPCKGLTMEPLRLCQLALNPPPEFHPQSLYAKVMSQETLYTIPGVWNAHYSLLTCPPQPFFTRLALRGEFFDTAS